MAQHDGVHAFYIPQEDPTLDADPEIERCVKIDEQTGKRCNYRRKLEEIEESRGHRKQERLRAEQNNQSKAKEARNRMVVEISERMMNLDRQG